MLWNYTVLLISFFIKPGLQEGEIDLVFLTCKEKEIFFNQLGKIRTYWLILRLVTPSLLQT